MSLGDDGSHHKNHFMKKNSRDRGFEFQEMKIGATSQVFRSDNYGLSYTDISSRFLLDNGERAVINKFYHHPKTNCRYVFTDILNRLS